MDFIDSFIWKPTIIVHSGHGLHVWWLFNKLWVFQNPAEREQAQKHLKNFQTNLIKLGQERGWNFDNVSDLARLMRIPGTWNHKSTPVPVTIFKQDLNLRYLPEEIQEGLANRGIDKKGCGNFPEATQEFAGDDVPHLQGILDECLFLQHCKKDADSLPEPAWYAYV